MKLTYSPDSEEGTGDGASCSTIGTKTDADERNDELQDANSDPTGRVAGDMFHSGTASA